jgi:uncharacterized DUF497 family protein
MQFTYDMEKRADVLAKHSVDILYAALIFDGPCLSWVDNRRDYREVRHISIGMVDDECFIVVHTQRDEITRLITAWKGGQSDRKKYQNYLAGRAESTQSEG